MVAMVDADDELLDIPQVQEREVQPRKVSPVVLRIHEGVELVEVEDRVRYDKTDHLVVLREMVVPVLQIPYQDQQLHTQVEEVEDNQNLRQTVRVVPVEVEHEEPDYQQQVQQVQRIQVEEVEEVADRVPVVPEDHE